MLSTLSKSFLQNRKSSSLKTFKPVNQTCMPKKKGIKEAKTSDYDMNDKQPIEFISSNIITDSPKMYRSKHNRCKNVP